MNRNLKKEFIVASFEEDIVIMEYASFENIIILIATFLEKKVMVMNWEMDVYVVVNFLCQVIFLFLRLQLH